ncbi:MAG: cupin domain-containing protein [Acetobacteraceae bacterium]|nr:cupin domain-containing protein [Acetobacteraceae bacterium]
MVTLVAGAATVQTAAPAPAVASGVTQKILNRADGPGGQLVSIQALAEVAAGVVGARHTHPGVGIGSILSGGGTAILAGAPARELKAGKCYLVAADTPHEFKTRPQATQILVTYVVDKNKPLASPRTGIMSGKGSPLCS